MKRLVLRIYIIFVALTVMACQSNEISKHNEHYNQWKDGFVPAH